MDNSTTASTPLNGGLTGGSTYDAAEDRFGDYPDTNGFYTNDTNIYEYSGFLGLDDKQLGNIRTALTQYLSPAKKTNYRTRQAGLSNDGVARFLSGLSAYKKKKSMPHISELVDSPISNLKCGCFGQPELYRRKVPRQQRPGTNGPRNEHRTAQSIFRFTPAGFR